MSAPAEVSGLAGEANLLSHWWSRPAEGDEAMPEYDRLFVGPGPVPCPPYESYWRVDVPPDLARSLMGPCVPVLVGLYRRLGIDVDPAAHELPDHVAVEFEALAFGLSQQGDAAAVCQSLVAEHLRVWLPKFCEAVERESKHQFYVRLSALTLSWLGGFG